MTENLLFYLWRQKRFNFQALETTDQQTLEIMHPGELNTHSGPDFSNARVRIGDTLWAGNIEIHVKASDWHKHQHSRDRAYQNTILHVVYESDTSVLDQNGTPYPCLELKSRIDNSLLDRFMALHLSKNKIPCGSQCAQVPSIIRLSWLDRLLIERLERKTAVIHNMVQQTEDSWAEAFYRSLARNFGLKVNAQPFELLAASLPLRILAKHKDHPHQIEALLFGQAGMLEEQFTDAYPESLRKEYHFLRHKYQLTPIDAVQWKYFRLRPAAFPTVRIAQFAALICASAHLFSKVMEAQSVRTIRHLCAAEVSGYWHTHYRFDTPAHKMAKPISKDLVHLIITNTIVPFWFLYGRERQIPELSDRAIALMDELPAEKNALIDDWAEVGIQAKSAAQAQALIQLRTEYCDKKKCASCAIGMHLLKA